MPFTDTEAAQIRSYLGYGSASLSDESYVDSYLSSTTETGVLQVRSILGQMSTNATRLIESGAGTAGIKAVDNGGVEFYQGAKLSELRSLLKTSVKQISTITQIPIKSDYFSPGCCPGVSEILNSGAF